MWYDIDILLLEGVLNIIAGMAVDEWTAAKSWLME